LERELIIASELAELNKLRFFLNQIFLETDLNRIYFNRVLLGLSEAVSNSIIHGNKNDCSKKVFISFLYQEKKLIISVKDEGSGFSIDNVEDPTQLENIKKESGRGLFLIQNIADEVCFFEGGNKIQILYSLG
jgi:serine/threonine-protein kinase RsbW